MTDLPCRTTIAQCRCVEKNLSLSMVPNELELTYDLGLLVLLSLHQRECIHAMHVAFTSIGTMIYASNHVELALNVAHHKVQDLTELHLPID